MNIKKAYIIFVHGPAKNNGATGVKNNIIMQNFKLKSID